MAAAVTLSPYAVPAGARGAPSSETMDIAMKGREEVSFAGKLLCKPVTTKKRPPNLPPLRDEAAHTQFAQLVEKVMREAGVDWDDSKEREPLAESLSEPSSPRLVLKRMAAKEDFSCENACNSSSTLTSEDDSPPSTRKKIPSVVISNENPFGVAELNQSESVDRPLQQKGERSGSLFYHMSFGSHQQPAHQPPLMYIPPSATLQGEGAGKGMKVKKRSGKLRGSAKNSPTSNHKPVITRVPPSPGAKPAGWVDYEDELQPVSKPSYFRHIGRIVSAGPGPAYTVELNKPPNGKLGIYIVQGYDEERQSRSVFISRFYQHNAEKFYAGLVHPRDELLAVGNRSVRETAVSEVQQLISGLERVRLTILPVGSPEQRPF